MMNLNMSAKGGSASGGKKYILILALAVIVITLSGCGPQTIKPVSNEPNLLNQTSPASSSDLNSSGQSDNINAQPSVTKDELDKLKADINNLQSDNPNGLSQ